MRNRNSRYQIFIAVSLAATLAAGCGHQSTPVSEPTPVRVSPAATLAETGGLRYSANIEALTQVTLSFKSAGFVDRVVQRKGADGRVRILQEGDRVSQGETLAHVRESEYADSVASAKAQVDQAQANYDKTKLDFERASNLYKTDSYTKAQYDAAKAAMDSNAASVENAKAAWQKSRTGLNDCYLQSPLSGWVLSRNVEIGALVGSGTQAFVLADTHLVKAVFGVPDTRVGFAKLGAAQTITTTSSPDEFHGRITSVSPSADAKSRTFEVEASIPNADGKLKAGMVASVGLAEEAAPANVRVALPLSSLVRPGAGSRGFAVYRLQETDGRARVALRQVQLAELVGDRVLVREGLASGDRVVTLGAALLHDGDAVRVIP